jgi:hypothetical protein
MERRKEKRTPAMRMVHFTALPERKKALKEGMTVDISSAGFGMFASSRLEEDTELLVTIEGLPAPRGARVRWCRKRKENLYKAGLSFN